MSSFQENIAKYHNWTIEYTNQVIHEYERFINLKATNTNIIPSEDINNLWQYHILNPSEYYNYCNTRFGKIIDYTFIDENLDIFTNISNTLIQYKNVFGDITYKNVWIFNLKLNIEQFNLLNNSQSTKSTIQPFQTIQSNQHFQTTQTIRTNIISYPPYNDNKPEVGFFKLYIVYKNNINLNPEFDKKIFDYKPSSINETIDIFIDVISKQINIIKNNITIKLHPEINIAFMDKSTILFNNLLKKTLPLNILINKYYNFLIIEID
jgi:hypothetical protein